MRSSPPRFPLPTTGAVAAASLGLLLSVGVAAPAHGHGVDYRVERAEAVVVRFSSHHEPAIVDAGFRVFAPDGRSLFAEGRTDSLGRAVFVPDAPGRWRLVMATADGHGAEVEVVLDETGLAAAEEQAIRIGSAERSTGRLSATAAGVGYLLGLGGLLALWRRREVR